MDAVEEIKSRLAIEDVIGEYVQLKRAGRNWRGLSPFTNERTPSFMVSPEKQIWHDFSSSKGGNMFSFVMEVEGLDFKGALELLARKAGVDLDQYGRGPGSSRTKEKERLYDALELAAKFYETCFKRFREPQDYVAMRAFTPETAKRFRLGYAPKRGGELANFMQARGFSAAELTKAGLATRRYQTLNDMFRGRLMIPLQDSRGRIIGFTARLLTDDPRAPKYINTPQTPLYDKSRHVFGLHLAKEAIRKNGYAVLVEGNLDVIASHQAGVPHVVATAGTALTQYQLKALQRFTNDVRLCFDADKAGVSATERAIPIASKLHVDLSIITIPNGKDPDELVRSDSKAWQKIITQPQYALNWLMSRYQSLLDLTTAPGKREFSDIMLKVIGKLEDSVEREHYIGEVAEILSTSRESLLTKMNTKTSEQRFLKKPKVTPRRIDRKKTEQLKRQQVFLSLLLQYSELRKFAEPLKLEMFIEPEAKTVFQFLLANPSFKGNEKMPKELRGIEDYVKMLSLLYEEEYQELDLVELADIASKLQANLIVEYTNHQEALLNKAYQALGEQNDDKKDIIRKKMDSLHRLRRAYHGKVM